MNDAEKQNHTIRASNLNPDDFLKDSLFVSSDNQSYVTGKAKTFEESKKDLEIKKLNDSIARDKKDHNLKLKIAYFFIGIIVYSSNNHIYPSIF